MSPETRGKPAPSVTTFEETQGGQKVLELEDMLLAQLIEVANECNVDIPGDPTLAEREDIISAIKQSAGYREAKPTDGITGTAAEKPKKLVAKAEKPKKRKGGGKIVQRVCRSCSTIQKFTLQSNPRERHVKQDAINPGTIDEIPAVDEIQMQAAVTCKACGVEQNVIVSTRKVKA